MKTALKFYADWCGPCQQFAPTVDAVFAAHPEIKLRSINVDQDPMTSFQYKVNSIPAIIFLEDDVVVGRVDGAVTDGLLRETITLAYQEVPHAAES